MRKDAADASRDKLAWKWRNGTIQAGDIPSPATQTDLALCLYHQNGFVLGGALTKGGLWSTNYRGDLQYVDAATSSSACARRRSRSRIR